MGDLGFGWDKRGAKWGGVVEVLDPELAGRDHRCAHLRPQHHDVDEGGGKAGLLRRGLRGAARASRRIHRRGSPRSSRSTARAAPGTRMLGRLPACAPGAQSAAGQGRQRHARDRRGSLRDGARIQGLAFRRARRRPRALGIPRADVRLAARARLRGGEGRGSIRSGCSIPARSCARRSSTTASNFRFAPGYRGDDLDDAARLVGLSGRGRRFPGRGRDVQQQRRLPQDGRRRRCARAIASPATSATSRAAAPIRCGSPSPASSGRTRWPPTRWRRR